MTERPATGPFVWNRWGWFGAQLGSTCWLVWASPYAAMRGEWLLSAILLGSLTLLNVVGTLLWKHRDRYSPYPAIQVFTTVYCLIVLLIVFTIGEPMPGKFLIETKGMQSLVLLICPLLMLQFGLMELLKHRNVVSTPSSRTES